MEKHRNWIGSDKWQGTVKYITVSGEPTSMYMDDYDVSNLNKKVTLPDMLTILNSMEPETDKR